MHPERLAGERADAGSGFPAHFVVNRVGADDLAIVGGEVGECISVPVQQGDFCAAVACGVNVDAQPVAFENERLRGERAAGAVRIHGDEAIHALRRAIDAAEILAHPLAAAVWIAIHRHRVKGIEAEQTLFGANRELITRFGQKIQATLARIWGSAE